MYDRYHTNIPKDKQMTREQVLLIVDRCCHAYASDYKDDARKLANDYCDEFTIVTQDCENCIYNHLDKDSSTCKNCEQITYANWELT